MKPIISVKNLVKTYGSHCAVKGINFEVYSGEIFGLLGQNGAGKTSTIEIMETLRPLTNGSVHIDGYSVARDAHKIKSCIGVQLQSSSFYPGLTLKETLFFLSALYNVSVDPIKLLAKVDLTDKQESLYDNLSGGQKQRFSICTTLINSPKIIFLDEPTTGLDPRARRNVWQLIKELKALGTTIVLTTHYLDEAEELCDRIAIMDDGHIVTLGTPHALIDQLLTSGFKKIKPIKEATLEDVFLAMTGKTISDE